LAVEKEKKKKKNAKLYSKERERERGGLKNMSVTETETIIFQNDEGIWVTHISSYEIAAYKSPQDQSTNTYSSTKMNLRQTEFLPAG